jgi:hypothetical protein
MDWARSGTAVLVGIPLKHGHIRCFLCPLYISLKDVEENCEEKPERNKDRKTSKQNTIIKDI